MAIVEAKKMSCGVENKVVNGQDKSLSDIRENDVVCEKGRGDHERWPGNKLYRYLVKVNKESYNDLTPMERSEVIGKIITTIREKSGWFVQVDEESGQWNELSEEKVRKKVSDDLRREVRRRRERRSNNTAFSAKLKALKDVENGGAARDILKPVEDPRETDVLFGAGARRHPGNKTYWKLMKSNLDHYIISPYGARSMISRSIVQGIKDQNGRFLEQDPKTAVWFEISDKRAIEKTSHALSNKKYKTRKRLPESPGAQYPSTSEAQDEDAASSTTESVESPSTVVHGEGHPSPKPRTKKHRLLQRMEDPVDLPKPITQVLGARPDAPGSPVADMTSDGKVSVPESPPAIQTEKEIKESDKRITISPNDSRTSPFNQKDPYHEEADGPVIKRYHGREQAEINEHAYTLAEMAAYPMPSAEPRYGTYHPSERYYRDGHSYSPSVRPLSDTPTYRRYVGPGWGPPHHREPVKYVPRTRSVPYYGTVSPRVSKERWVYTNKWARPGAVRAPLEAIPRGHPDDPRSW
jgi:hypothetical protein